MFPELFLTPRLIVFSGHVTPHVRVGRLFGLVSLRGVCLCVFPLEAGLMDFIWWLLATSDPYAFVRAGLCRIELQDGELRSQERWQLFVICVTCCM